MWWSAAVQGSDIGELEADGMVQVLNLGARGSWIQILTPNNLVQVLSPLHASVSFLIFFNLFIYLVK